MVLSQGVASVAKEAGMGDFVRLIKLVGVREREVEVFILATEVISVMPADFTDQRSVVFFGDSDNTKIVVKGTPKDVLEDVIAARWFKTTNQFRSE